eukprot:GHVH01004843.1.p1 GENE.GHVH01004843.1~~GHVH01004843.1.p1  ORF type:complete len:3590 (+),score=538.13 GHVH01004843.1:354-11123(+)
MPSIQPHEDRPLGRVERCEHDNGVWGDAAYGPVGRLDHGKLEVLQVKGSIRSEFHQDGRRVNVEEVLSVLDGEQNFQRRKISSESDPSGYRTSFFSTLQYGVLTEALIEMIENEPSSWLRERMIDAVINFIVEVLMDEKLDERAVRGVARIKCDTLDFTASGRFPPITEDDYRSTFLAEMIQTSFSQSQESLKSSDMCPVVSHDAPKDIGEPLAFRHCYLEYKASWVANNRDTGGHLFRTSFIGSALSVPVLCMRVYKKISKSVNHLIGTAHFQTSTLLDCTEPYKRLTVEILPILQYDVVMLKDHAVAGSSQSVVASFKYMWQLQHYFSNTGFNAEVLDSAIRQCLSNQGEMYEMDQGFGLQISSHLPYKGELYLDTFFAPSNANKDAFNHNCKTLQEYRDYQLTCAMPESDSAGAPIMDMVYNPNLDAMARRYNSQTKDEDVIPELWEYNRYDLDDHLRMEGFDRYLQNPQMHRWKRFFNAKDSKGNLIIDRGPSQWEAVMNSNDVYQRMEYDQNGSWMSTIAESLVTEPPRFLLELWMIDGSGEKTDFCGELLLPRVHDLKSSMQNRKLFRLSRSSKSSVLTRYDASKDASGHPFTGWVNLHATWRMLNPKLCLLNLKLHELRDVNTANTKPDETQPGVPQVCIWMYDAAKQKWSFATQFTPFMYALNFLHKGQAKESMRSLWKWDALEMGMPEPDWKNYFGWDKPGTPYCEEREFPINIDCRIPVEHKLHFVAEDFDRNDISLQIWRLIKGGVPRIMRPYLWVQLTCAHVAEKRINDIWRKIIPSDSRLGTTSAYTYLVQLSEMCYLPIFDVINEDLRTLRDSKSLTSEFSNAIYQIVTALVMFSTSPEPLALPLKDGGSCAPDYITGSFILGRGKEPNEVNVGRPIVYNRGMMLIAYRLLLDIGNYVFHPEMVFYVMFALLAGGGSKNDVLEAPFFKYYGQYPFEITKEDKETALQRGETPRRKTLIDQVPYPIRDSIVIRSALEVLFPEKADVFHRAGVSIEDLCYGPLMSLCSGSLPSQSLYRLWDMLFCVLYSPRAIVESSISFIDVQNKLAAALASRQSSKVDVVDREAIVAEATESIHTFDGRHRSATGLFFDGSFSRRVIVSFLFSVILQTTHSVPAHASAKEIKICFSNIMRGLRDPCELVRMTERGDFQLFTSNLNIDYISKLWKCYISSKHVQMTPFRKQNQVMLDIMHRKVELYGQRMPAHTICITNKAPEYLEDKFRAIPMDYKCSVTQFAKYVYPAIKYHSCFAPAFERFFPDDGLGKLFVKLDQLELQKPLGKNLAVMMKVNNDVQIMRSSNTMTENKFIWSDNNVFTFLLHDPPPYKISFHIMDPDDEDLKRKLIASTKALSITDLATNGDNFRYLGPEFFTSSEGPVRLWVSWSTFSGPLTNHTYSVRPGPQFSPGEGTWGAKGTHHQLGAMMDYREFHARWKQKMLKSHVREEHNPLSQGPKVIPMRKSGAIKAEGWSVDQIKEIIFHTIPTIVPEVDRMVNEFAFINSSGEETLETCQASFVDMLAHMIISCRGSYLSKASMLFDLFGHFEKERDDAAAGKMLHQLYYDVHPWAVSQELLDRAQRFEAVLPAGSITEIRDLQQTMTNVIHINEIVPMIQQLLLRNGMHLDNYQTWSMAHHVFEPQGHCPSILHATICSDDSPNHHHVDHSSDSSSRDGSVVESGKSQPVTSRFRRVIGMSPKKTVDVDEDVEQPSSVDVTYPIRRYVEKFCNETNFFGIDFNSIRDINDLGIRLPFHGGRSTLKIAVSNGWPDHVDIVSLVFDSTGVPVSGSGGNYTTHVATNRAGFMSRAGPFGHNRTDLIPLSSPLIAGTYIFGSQVALDKRVFLTRLLGNEMLLDSLTRPTCVDRMPTTKSLLDANVTVEMSTGIEEFDSAMPVRFINEQDAKPLVCCAHNEREHCHKHDGPLAKDDDRAHGPSLIARDGGGKCKFSISEEEPLKGKFMEYDNDGQIIMSTLPSDLSLLRRLRVHIHSVDELYPTGECQRLDPYVKVSYDGQKKKTPDVKNHGAFTVINYTLEFNLNHEDIENQVIKIHALDNSRVAPRSLGFGELSLSSILAHNQMKTLPEYLPLSKGNPMNTHAKARISFSFKSVHSMPPCTKDLWRPQLEEMHRYVKIQRFDVHLLECETLKGVMKGLFSPFVVIDHGSTHSVSRCGVQDRSNKELFKFDQDSSKFTFDYDRSAHGLVKFSTLNYIDEKTGGESIGTMEVDIRDLIHNLHNDKTPMQTGSTHEFEIPIRRKDHHELTGKLRFSITPTFTEDLALKEAVQASYPANTEYHLPMLTSERPEYISIFLKGAEDLNSKAGPFEKPTAVLNFGPSQQARCREGEGKNPEWNSMFKFNFRDELDAEDLHIDVVDMSNDSRFGRSSLNVNELVRFQFEHGHPWSGKVPVFSSKKEPMGHLLMEVDFLSSPMRYPKMVMVHLHDAQSLQRDEKDDKSFIFIDIAMGRDSRRTRRLDPNEAPEGDTMFRWEEQFHMLYQGANTIGFTVAERDPYDGLVRKTLGRAEFDVWNQLRQGAVSQRGRIQIVDEGGRIAGSLGITVTFMNPPPKELWPDYIRVYALEGQRMLHPEDHDQDGAENVVIRMDCGNVDSSSPVFPNHRAKKVRMNHTAIWKYNGELPLKIAVLNADDELNYISTSGGSIPMGHVIGSSALSVWDLIEKGDRISEGDIPLSSPFGGPGGFIRMRIELLFGPKHAPDYMKATVRSGVQLYRTVSDSHKSRDPVVILDLGPNKVKATTALKNATKTGLHKWDEDFVFRYEKEPLIGLRVTDTDSGSKNELIGAAVINLWDVLNQSEVAHDHVHIYKNGKKVGKVSISFDWYNRPPVEPKFVRLAIRQGFNLLKSTRGTRADPFIAAGMGKHLPNHRRTKFAHRDSANPSFGDEVLYLPWDPSAEYLRLRMFDEPPSKYPDDSERLGYVKLHIWDLIRDPTRAYSGTVKLRRDFEPAGSVRIEAVLISDIQLPVRFCPEVRTLGPQVQGGHGFAISENESVGTVLRKVQGACSVLKRTSDHQRKEFYVFGEDGLTNGSEVVMKTHDGMEFVLDDDAILLEYPIIRKYLLLHENPKAAPQGELGIQGLGNKAPLQLCVRPKKCTSGNPLQRTKSVVPNIMRGGKSTNDMSVFKEFPSHASLMPFPKTQCPVFEDHKFWWTLPQKEIRTPKIQSVARTEFELHPDCHIPLKNLAWVKVPNRSYIKAASEHAMPHLSERLGTWALACAFSGSGKASTVGLLDHVETKIGFDRPKNVETFTSKDRDTLYCFDTGDGCTAISPPVQSRHADYIPNDPDYDYPPGVAHQLPDRKRKRRLGDGLGDHVSSDESMSISSCSHRIKSRTKHKHDDGLCIHCKGTGRYIPGYTPIGKKPGDIRSRSGSGSYTYSGDYTSTDSPRRVSPNTGARIKDTDRVRHHALGPKNNRDEFVSRYDDESSAADRKRRNESRQLRNQERDQRRKDLAKHQAAHKDEASDSFGLSTLGSSPGSSASTATRKRYAERKAGRGQNVAVRDPTVSSVSSLSSMSKSLGRAFSKLSSSTVSESSSDNKNPIPALRPQLSLNSSVAPQLKNTNRDSKTFSEEETYD